VRISADSFYDVGILGARAVIPSVSRGIPWSYLKDFATGSLDFARDDDARGPTLMFAMAP